MQQDLRSAQSCFSAGESGEFHGLVETAMSEPVAIERHGGHHVWGHSCQVAGHEPAKGAGSFEVGSVFEPTNGLGHGAAVFENSHGAMERRRSLDAPGARVVFSRRIG